MPSIYRFHRRHSVCRFFTSFALDIAAFECEFASIFQYCYISLISSARNVSSHIDVELEKFSFHPSFTAILNLPSVAFTALRQTDLYWVQYSFSSEGISLY